MTIAELNAASQDEFVHRLGHIFEDSPWVAERAWQQRPFASVAELHSALVRQVEEAQPHEQLQLIRSHPDLGSHSPMSAASIGEQAKVGLAQLTPDEDRSLQALNNSYRMKFGFPFLLAVKASDKRDILQALRRRLESTPEDEFREALSQAHKIAAFRLEHLLGTGEE